MENENDTQSIEPAINVIYAMAELDYLLYCYFEGLKDNPKTHPKESCTPPENQCETP